MIYDDTFYLGDKQRISEVPSTRNRQMEMQTELAHSLLVVFAKQSSEDRLPESI